MLSVISIRKLNLIIYNIDKKYENIIKNITKMQLEKEINNININKINCKDIDDQLILEMNSIINTEKINKNSTELHILSKVFKDLLEFEETLKKTINTNEIILSNLETFDNDIRNNILFEIINITNYESKSLNENLIEIQNMIYIISNIISLDFDFDFD